MKRDKRETPNRNKLGMLTTFTCREFALTTDKGLQLKRSLRWPIVSTHLMSNLSNTP